MTALAARYHRIIIPSRLHEEELLRVERHMPEIELQARWFDGEFGTEFTTTDGRELKVLQFGVWNREAGPDFSEAAISIDGVIRRGAAELDSTPLDWEAHGHSTNPDYEDVILHVCARRGSKQFFSRTRANREVPQVFLDLSRLDPEPPAFLPGAKPGRCVAPLADLGPDKAVEILEAAAAHRLRRKSVRLAQIARVRGRDEALFQAIATALGYKHNKLPFTLLAQRLPLQLLQRRRDQALPLLFGVSGFLTEPDLAKLPPASRRYVRELWEPWWPNRAKYERLILPKRLWRMGGVRPVNHPQRRLAALASLLHHWPTLRRFSRRPDARKFRDFCDGLRDDFWNSHYSLTSRPTSGCIAILGASRAADILANVLFPIAYADDPSAWDKYRELPAELGNRRVSTAATRLFGRANASPALTRRMMYQQGLLQIYEDFCMRDSTDCQRCRLPEQLAGW